MRKSREMMHDDDIILKIVFVIHSQSAVFEGSCGHLPFVALSGGTATVLAYGQTGSGKTHTMRGPQQQSPADEPQHGIMHKFAQQLFDLIDRAVPVGGGKKAALGDETAEVLPVEETAVQGSTSPAPAGSGGGSSTLR